MSRKLSYIFIFTFFSLAVGSEGKRPGYQAELVNIRTMKGCGSITIPYSPDYTKLVIIPSDILDEIKTRAQSSYMRTPQVSLGRHMLSFQRDRIHSDSETIEKPMPTNQDESLKFFLDFESRDSHARVKNSYVFDEEGNGTELPVGLKEGDIISVNQKFKVFKDPFTGKLFIKLGTSDAFSQPDPIDDPPDIETLIKDGQYTIISSAEEKTPEKNTFSFSYMPCCVFVGLLLIITNFCTYKITAQKNKSDSLHKNQ